PHRGRRARASARRTPHNRSSRPPSAVARTSSAGGASRRDRSLGFPYRVVSKEPFSGLMSENWTAVTSDTSNFDGGFRLQNLASSLLYRFVWHSGSSASS